jgi:hypothetical protein
MPEGIEKDNHQEEINEFFAQLKRHRRSATGGLCSAEG